MLKRAAIELPRWAVRVSDLVPVEKKVHFADELVPEMAARARAGELDDAWLDAQLADYGRDSRVLVRPGVVAWLETTDAPSEVVGPIAAAFGL